MRIVVGIFLNHLVGGGGNGGSSSGMEGEGE